MKALSGKIALITGASSGIGAATAKKLAEAGAKVGIAARRADRLEALKAEIELAGGQALVLEMDVADKASVEAGVKTLLDTWGKLDIVFNNAGVMPLSNIDEFKTDEWESMVDVNIKGVLHVTAAVLPSMIAQHSGHIVNTSSVAGRKVFGQGFSVYSATKYAVSAFTEGLRMEVGKTHNIRVTSIQPGATQSELPNSTTSQGYKEMMASFSGQMRMLEASDIANAVVFAVSAPEHVNVAELYVLPTSQV
ncbi:SDR family oxidoreductase [Pectobacterium odoriferum]|uniref:Oxidoreductase n=1 Tax=Pectobacterium odoriferum TaxID=78398 RepID=A0ABR4VST7_9GAMM|nr:MULTISPECIES: SDR family oxidoreductase [Pectobacterium]KGA34591.1 oxidoreductase [Pectobacterium odoriferum]KGA42455.1 oxidoreductase [Pectobacterium odoriferum]MDE8754497.1 SDR family oxidoreductase [Pectobacterium polaris]